MLLETVAPAAPAPPRVDTAAPRPPVGRLERLATFLSAFLLFSVVVLLGKEVLPWFGGSAGVWTTCMLFFQVLLLLGYLYAHRVSMRPRGGSVHLALLSISALLLVGMW